MVSGIKMGRDMNFNFGFCSFASIAFSIWLIVSIAIDDTVVGTGSFNHKHDLSASFKRFLLRNQTGDSGRSNMRTPHETES